jgi:hypothetical protein
LHFLPGIALNCDSPNLHFWSSWDYRCLPSSPALDKWFWTLTKCHRSIQQCQNRESPLLFWSLHWSVGRGEMNIINK